MAAHGTCSGRRQPVLRPARSLLVNARLHHRLYAPCSHADHQAASKQDFRHSLILALLWSHASCFFASKTWNSISIPHLTPTDVKSRVSASSECFFFLIITNALPAHPDPAVATSRVWPPLLTSNTTSHRTIRRSFVHSDQQTDLQQRQENKRNEAPIRVSFRVSALPRGDPSLTFGTALCPIPLVNRRFSGIRHSAFEMLVCSTALLNDRFGHWPHYCLRSANNTKLSASHCRWNANDAQQ